MTGQQEKRVTWDMLSLQDETRRRYELTDAQASALLGVATGVMQWATRWENTTPEDARLFADALAYRLMTPVEDGGEKIVITRRSGGVIVIESESEDNMRFYTENINGNVFLVEDCGCGELRKFSLNEVTGDDFSGNESSTGYPSNVPALSTPSSRTCFDAKAGAAIISSLLAFSSRIYDVARLGIDTYAPDEAIDIVGEIVDFTLNTNRWEGLLTSTETQIEDALASYETSLVGNLSLGGPITRKQLRDAVDATYPELDGVIPVGRIASTWARFANIKAINSRLAIAQAECESGSTALPPPVPDLTLDVGGTDYIAFNVINSPVALSGGDTYTAPRDFGPISGLAWTATKQGAINNPSTIKAGSTIISDSGQEFRNAGDFSADSTNISDDVRAAQKSQIAGYGSANLTDFGAPGGPHSGVLTWQIDGAASGTLTITDLWVTVKASDVLP